MAKRGGRGGGLDIVATIPIPKIFYVPKSKWVTAKDGTSCTITAPNRYLVDPRKQVYKIHCYNYLFLLI